MVIDGFGIGEMPDAALFGDEGSDTYGHVVAATQIMLPCLAVLGLNNICGIGPAAAQFRVPAPNAAYGRMSEKTFAKDTTAGHYELAGLVMQKPFRVFPNGFPEDIVRDLEKATGVQFMGNEVASGTEIIQRLGEEHLRTGKIILYTSQDSVMQIASDTSVLPLAKLYDVCEAARAVMTGERTVGRVIARPFFHDECGHFRRTKDRKDYSLEPPGQTLLDRLAAANIPVCARPSTLSRRLWCWQAISLSWLCLSEPVSCLKRGESPCIKASVPQTSQAVSICESLSTRNRLKRRNQLCFTPLILPPGTVLNTISTI